MKAFLAALAVAAVSVCTMPGAVAQEVGASPEQVEEARALVREGARELVREGLSLSPEKSEEFWPLYDRYQKEIVEIEDPYVELLREFLQKYYGYSLTDDDAREYVDTYFDVQNDRLKVRKKYLRRFRKVLSDIEVMRLYQIENKIRAEVDAMLAITVPLADPS